MSEWLDRRKLGITGTDVWAEKTGRMEPDDLSGREEVYWGSRLEEIVLLAHGEPS